MRSWQIPNSDTFNQIKAPIKLDRRSQLSETWLEDEATDADHIAEKFFSAPLIKLGFEVIKPQGAFFMFPKSPIPDDVAFVKEAQKEKVLLVPGSGFGKPGFFRIAFCCEKQTIENAFPKFHSLAKKFGLI